MLKCTKPISNAPKQPTGAQNAPRHFWIKKCVIIHIGTQVLILYLSSFSFCQKPLNTRFFCAFINEINFIVTEISFIVSKNSFIVKNSPFLFGCNNSYLCDTIYSIKKKLLNAHQHFLKQAIDSHATS